MMEWQPIETAPKDEFLDVLLWDGKNVSMGSYSGMVGIDEDHREYYPCHQYQCCASDDCRTEGIYPTHWIHLPKAPS